MMSGFSDATARERLLGVAGLDRVHRHARVLERAAHERTDIGLVVDDQYFHAASAGSRTTNVDPPPGVSS